jgi:hypothetical protein
VLMRYQPELNMLYDASELSRSGDRVIKLPFIFKKTSPKSVATNFALRSGEQNSMRPGRTPSPVRPCPDD